MSQTDARFITTIRCANCKESAKFPETRLAQIWLGVHRCEN